MRPTVPVLVAALVSVLVACGDVDADVGEIRGHQRQWQAQDIDDYVFVWFMGCFCDIPDLVGVRVQVEAGEPISAIGLHGVPFDDYARTIDDLFGEAIASAKLGPDEYEISYDPKRHFIKNVSVDQDDDAEDDGYLIDVRCFSTEADGCPIITLTTDECEEMSGTTTPLTQDDPENTCVPPYP